MLDCSRRIAPSPMVRKETESFIVVGSDLRRLNLQLVFLGNSGYQGFPAFQRARGALFGQLRNVTSKEPNPRVSQY